MYLTFHQTKELRFGARVSLRSFFVDWALKRNCGIKVLYKGNSMTLEPDDLREKGVHNKNSKHKAMFDGQGIKAGEDYYLVDYRFVPDNMKEEVKSRQIRLFDPII